MTERQFLKALYEHRLHKKDINALVAVVLHHPKLTQTLIKSVGQEDKTDSFNASWVFDHAMRTNLESLLPYLSDFVNLLPKLTSESCLRPMAHTCEMLILSYFVKKQVEFRATLTKGMLDVLVEVNFDWLIGEHKVATKVFAMTSLFYLGERFDWVRPELKSTIEKYIAHGSAGFKNRGQKTLDKLGALGY